MPIVSDLSLDSLVYDAEALTMTATGGAFSELQGDAGKLEYRLSGAVVWTEVDGYDSWGDSEVVGTVLAALSHGVYEARITNGDNEVSDALESAFEVSGASQAKRLYKIGYYN